MKKLYYIILLIIILAGVSEVIDSCKKEKQDFPEADFIKELKRGWYVGYYTDNDTSQNTFWSYSFDGDSTVNIYGDDYFVGDPYICRLIGIENLQIWTFNENNGKLQLNTKDVCGNISNYLFTYSGYNSIKQISGDGYVINADVKLMGNDTVISIYQFILFTYPSKPHWDDIQIDFERDGRPRCNLYPKDTSVFKRKFYNNN